MSNEILKITEGNIRELNSEEKKKFKTKYKYVVLSECIYETNDKKIIVPVGFLTDGSTGGPDYGCSWLFHDYLYATHAYTSGEICTREEADDIFIKVLRYNRMFAYAWTVEKLAALNPFWLFSRAWVSSGKRGAEYLNIVERDLEKELIIE